MSLMAALENKDVTLNCILECPLVVVHCTKKAPPLYITLKLLF